jgi:hypothetical protein
MRHRQPPQQPLLIFVLVKHLFDFVSAHRVEIVRHGNLPTQKAEPLNLTLKRSVDWRDLYQRLAGFGDDERLALGGAINEARQIFLASLIPMMRMRATLSLRRRGRAV